MHVQKCWAFEMRHTVMRRVSKFVPFFHQLAIWRLAVTALISLIYVPIIVRPIVAFVAVGSRSILVLFAQSLTVVVSLSVSPVSVRSVLPSPASSAVSASASASAPIAASIASAATTVLHGVAQPVSDGMKQVAEGWKLNSSRVEVEFAEVAK